jgi:hypothetical protein
MTRTFQPNPFLEFAAEMEAREAQTRARTRATNGTNPRCAICGGRFIGDVDEVIEFARAGAAAPPGFLADDLICAVDWYEIWGERGGHA